jgi:hypothetical protein
VGIHLGPRGYDLTALREGRGRFYPIEEAELGPVAGKRVLHLQCHFGSDTLKFAQRGANAVGLDFSAGAIATARRLAGELGLADRADFVLADLYNAPAAIAEPAGFDIVFVSWGAICWLPDIHRWAEIGKFGPGEIELVLHDSEMISSLLRDHPTELTEIINNALTGRTEAAVTLASQIGLTEEAFHQRGGGPLFWIAIAICAGAIFAGAATNKPR